MNFPGIWDEKDGGEKKRERERGESREGKKYWQWRGHGQITRVVNYSNWGWKVLSLSFSLPWDLDCCKESRNELCFARLAGFVFCVAQGVCALMRVCVCVKKGGKEGFDLCSS